MKLKYECPTSSKLGDDPPLWKTATTDFLKTAAQCVRSLAQFGQGVPLLYGFKLVLNPN